MEEVTIIGIDLAKRSFRVHEARADVSVAYPQEAAGLSRLKAGVYGGDGGVRQCPIMGP